MVANSLRQEKRLPYNSFEVDEQRGLRFLIGERFGTLLAPFHDEFVECRIDGEGDSSGKLPRLFASAAVSIQRR